MNSYPTIWAAVLPVFGIMACGFVLRRLEWLTEQADASLLRVTIQLLVPCLVLDSALGNAALAEWRNLLWAPLTGFGTVALGMAVAARARPLHGLREPAAARTFTVTVGLYNYGYVPIPLAWLLFDKPTTGVLFLFMVGVETALWTLGVLGLAARGSGGVEWRRLCNAPLLAIVLALGLNSVQGREWVPAPLLTAVHWLGQCAIPTALLLIGAVIADYLPQFRLTQAWRVMGTAVLLRLGLLPVLFLVLARWLPGTPELQRVLVLEAAMPSAVFPILMARQYGGDVPTALQVVLSTSVVSLATMPWWIRTGLAWLGLGSVGAGL